MGRSAHTVLRLFPDTLAILWRGSRVVQAWVRKARNAGSIPAPASNGRTTYCEPYLHYARIPAACGRGLGSELSGFRPEGVGATPAARSIGWIGKRDCRP